MYVFAPTIDFITFIDVYKIAEVIRLKHLDENVAREDIIEELVLRAGLNTILEFNTPDNSFDDILHVIDGPEIEMLMPLDRLKTAH